MIKVAKRATYTILETVDATDEELMTTFTGAEALMHSKPLMYQAEDTPIIPKHFLIGHVLFKSAPDTVKVQFSCNFHTIFGFDSRKSGYELRIVGPSGRRNRNTSKSMMKWQRTNPVDSDHLAE